MNRLEAMQIFAVAGTLAAFVVVPSMADDIAQPVQSREPVYVWQGNRIGGQRASAETTDLPQVVQAGSVRYITGGIGDEERAALEAVKNEYNLHITSTDNAGEFNGDTQITVRDRGGQTLVNAEAGPLFYADLPAGTYTVEAISVGRSEERKVTVGQQKPSSLYFRW